MSTRKYCHVGNIAKQCRLGLFQDSDFAGDLFFFRNRLQVEHCAYSESHVCSNKPVCKKQTCVVHSSTDSEIISVDTGLRMDGIPVLDPWDLVIVVMHSNSNQKQKDKQARRNLLHDKASEKRVNFRLTKYREMFEVRISAAAKEKTPTRASGKSYDMENHAKKCVERFVS